VSCFVPLQRLTQERKASDTVSPIAANTLVASSLICSFIRARTTVLIDTVFSFVTLELHCSSELKNCQDLVLSTCLTPTHLLHLPFILFIITAVSDDSNPLLQKSIFLAFSFHAGGPLL
jgi:hypothetical protein